MVREDFLDFLKEESKRDAMYLVDPLKYVAKIKHIALSEDERARIIVFGSYVRGDMRPNSDIDVLIITCRARDTEFRAKLRTKIGREIGLATPLEIHIVTPEEYEKWYRSFIKDAYIEV